MKQIELTAKELLVLSAQLGAKNLLGVRDPFGALERSEMLTEIATVQLQSEKDGLAQMDFDGNFRVSPDAIPLLTPCTTCKKYISVECSCNGVLRTSRNLYAVDSSLTMLEQTGEHIVLRSIGRDQAAEHLLPSGELALDVTINADPFDLPISALNRLREQDEQVVADDLKAMGCPSSFAQLISAALQQKSICYVITFFNYEAGIVLNRILLTDGKSGIIAELIDTEDGTPLRFQNIDKAGITMLMETFIEKLLSNEEG